jgi:hypothetical protein
MTNDFLLGRGIPEKKKKKVARAVFGIAQAITEYF